MLDDILNNLEKELVIGFNENLPMKEAVKKIILQFIYSEGTIEKEKSNDLKENWAMVSVFNEGSLSNEELGARIRAKAEGLRFLNNAFERLDEFKRPTETKEKENKAK